MYSSKVIVYHLKRILYGIKYQKRLTKSISLYSAKHDLKQMFNTNHLLLTISFILFVIIATLVSLMSYIMHQEWTSLFQSSINFIEAFPVPCASLSLSGAEDFVTFDVNRGDLKTFIDNKGNYICSGKNLTEIVQTSVEREGRFKLAQGNEKRYLACGNENLRERSGYQTFYFREILKKRNTSDTQHAGDKLYWKRHSNTCYMDKSLHYDNGEVTIPEGQDYYLYASVHFKISRKNINDQKWSQIPQRITVRLCKSVFGYEQTLQARSELFNITHSEYLVGSLRVETYVNLKRNDKIYVRVNDASKIIYGSKGNTFGMFPL